MMQGQQIYEIEYIVTFMMQGQQIYMKREHLDLVICELARVGRGEGVSDRPWSLRARARRFRNGQIKK